MARRGQRQSGATRPAARRRRPADDADGLIQVLARAVREVESAVERGAVRPSVRTKFQVVALLVREERARVNSDASASDTYRSEQLRRLDGCSNKSANLSLLPYAIKRSLSFGPGRYVPIT